MINDETKQYAQEQVAALIEQCKAGEMTLERYTEAVKLILARVTARVAAHMVIGMEEALIEAKRVLDE